MLLFPVPSLTLPHPAPNAPCHPPPSLSDKDAPAAHASAKARTAAAPPSLEASSTTTASTASSRAAPAAAAADHNAAALAFTERSAAPMVPAALRMGTTTRIRVTAAPCSESVRCSQAQKPGAQSGYRPRVSSASSGSSATVAAS